MELSEEEKRALRGSKFAPLGPPSCSMSSRSRHPPRLAHPGGPMKTNKAAALAKFLERKLQDPDGLSTINPNLIELAVQNAKRTVLASSDVENAKSIVIRHVASFSDSEQEIPSGAEKSQMTQKSKKKRKKQKKKKSKNKNVKMDDDGGLASLAKPKKKVKV